MVFEKRITCAFQIVSSYLLLISFFCLEYCQAKSTRQYRFVIKEAPYTRLCSTKNILTVNGMFPGPTIRAYQGDTVFVEVHNQGTQNITVHWHGVLQPRNPWTDGPEYITQCPIQPGGKFNQKIIFSTEIGTLWWHAHSDWTRATVHGALNVYPKKGTKYPFPKPHKEVPIILGEWWKRDVAEVLDTFLETGGRPSPSDALTINGQPGDLCPCSKSDTLLVEQNKTYLLRIVGATVNSIVHFSVANHNLTVVGWDGSYTKPLTTEYITISSGQTMDVLLTTNQNSSSQYYMASRVYSSGLRVQYVNTTATVRLQYKKNDAVPSQPSTSPILPYFPEVNDTKYAFNFITKLRGLVDKDNPIKVPQNVTTKIFSTLSINASPCPKNTTCEGPNGTVLAASMNNISFVKPSVSVLEAYYNGMKGVFQTDFPEKPPLAFDFTYDLSPLAFQLSSQGTKLNVLDYGSTVEIIFQATSVVTALDHPIHLHGYSFYVLGYGFGNFNETRDKLTYNLVDPPLVETVVVPKNGWATIRFTADNPGVWFMHCHFDRHLVWGMETVFIVKNGKNGPKEKMLPRPSYMPQC